ncbi:MAG: dTMP kinase [Candidatus Aenigmarchaeota archaeon]|nr:dTMP kinase [Candidatus Aenigmarchaeota archaeon]
MPKGLFIVIEGPDGSGQTTQAELLAKWFERRGYKVKVTKEPTNSIIGGIIRSVLQNELKIDLRTLALLFAADRSHHVEKVIKPLLRKGVVVISDRYALSTIVYESLDGLDVEWLKQINSMFPVPDVTIILDVPGKICVERIKKARFGFEMFETQEKLEKIRKRYLELKDVFPNTFVVDGKPKPEVVHRKIVEIIKRFL